MKEVVWRKKMVSSNLRHQRDSGLLRIQKITKTCLHKYFKLRAAKKKLAAWKAFSSFLWVEAVLSWNVQQKEELTSFPLLLKPAVFLEIAFESRDKGGGMPSLSNVSWNSEFANYKNFYSPSPKRWVPNWELELDGVFCQANKTRVLHFLCLSQMQLCILLAYLA